MDEKQEIKIREATQYDISELLRLGWNGYKEMEFLGEGIEYDTAAVSKLYLSILETPSIGTIYVAEHPTAERKLVARIVSIVTPFLHNPAFSCAYVIGVYVEKKYRGKKIGTLLIDKVKEWAKSRDIRIFVIHHRAKSGSKVRDKLENDNFKPLETIYYKVMGKD